MKEVDVEGNPFSYLRRLVFGGVVSKVCIPRRDALECEVPDAGGEVKIQLELHGHYGESDVSLDFKVTPGSGKPSGRTLKARQWYYFLIDADFTKDVSLSYDPYTGQWEITGGPVA